MLAALVAVFTTIAIVIVLVAESLPFFKVVPLREFLTDTMWVPLLAGLVTGSCRSSRERW